MEELTAGQAVVHERFGAGHVEFSKGETVIVRFKHGLEEGTVASLLGKTGVRDLIRAQRFPATQETLCRTLAAAIVSVNDSWGVCSK